MGLQLCRCSVYDGAPHVHGADGVTRLATADEVDTDPRMPPRSMLYAYTEAHRGGKKFDIRIGVAFETKDGIVVQLDAVPINGRLYLKKATD